MQVLSPFMVQVFYILGEHYLFLINLPSMNRKFISFYLALVFILAACNAKKEKKISQPEGEWVSKADSIVAETFDTLRNTLLKTIREKGFDGAIAFCNTGALPLTNTYARDGIFVKRTSDRLRNTANAPDTTEQRILEYYRKLKGQQGTLKPISEQDAEGNFHYYKPIIVQEMCLNCHGDKTTAISPATMAAIQKLYPSDSAFNYKVGDLRGLWHVRYTPAHP